MDTPDLPMMDERDGPPSSAHLIGYAAIELLIVAQDIDLWLKLLDLTNEASAVAKLRLDP